MAPRTRRSRSGSGTARNENSPGDRCCWRSACRSSFSTSRPPMTFCAMPASISPRRIFWVRQDKFDDRPENETEALDLAAVLAHQIGGGAASGHFAFQLLEAQPRVAFAIVHELDRGILRHRPRHERGRILADRFVDIICAIILAHRPFEADRG